MKPASPVTPVHLAASPHSQDMALTMADFRAYMDENTNKRLESIDNKIIGLGEKVDKHEGIIRENQGNIAALKTEIEKLKSAPSQAWPPFHAARFNQTRPQQQMKRHLTARGEP